MTFKNKMVKKLSFKPTHVTKHLIVALPERARDIVVARFGLNSEAGRKTLEAIGNEYGITRERVRQIENHALHTIRRSEHYKKFEPHFSELEKIIRSLGSVVAEDHLLEELASNDTKTRNHLVFLLELGPFKKKKEDLHLKHRWYIDEKVHDQIHRAVHALYESLSDEELISEPEMINRFLEEVKDVSDEYRNEEIARRWLSIAKRINKNPLGDWGRSTSPNVRVKGMRDYAYLVLRKHGSPMHFREVAEKIESMFGRSAHIATTHNELIKDKRFVLVGRGLYALREWGYITGVVKDVITQVLAKHGPLSKDEVIDKVTKERYVKPNTILVNLQDTNLFGRDEQGRYFVKT